MMETILETLQLQNAMCTTLLLFQPVSENPGFPNRSLVLLLPVCHPEISSAASRIHPVSYQEHMESEVGLMLIHPDMQPAHEVLSPNPFVAQALQPSHS